MKLAYNTFAATMNSIITTTAACHAIQEEVHFDPFMEFPNDPKYARSRMDYYLQTKSTITRYCNELVSERKGLIAAVLSGSLDDNRRVMRDYAQKYLSERTDKLASQIIEYELTFLGINYPENFTFCPWFLRQLQASDQQEELFAEYLPRMSKNEKDRRLYSQHTDFDTNWAEDWGSAEDAIRTFVEGKEKALEIGFWNQTLQEIMLGFSPNLTCYGADISAPAVKSGRDKGVPRLYISNAIWAIPLPDKSVDGIIMSTFIIDTMLPSPEMKRVVKKGGQIVHFVLPNLQKLEIFEVK